MSSLLDQQTFSVGFALIAAFIWLGKSQWAESLSRLTGASAKASFSQQNTDSHKDGGSDRDFLAKMDQQGKKCVVFFGTETGTAEAYARRLAREIEARFQVPTLLADLEDYDYGNLAEAPSNKLIVFVLATAGDGDATNNAVEFFQALSDTADQGTSLAPLRYAAFGLGNRSYEHFNATVRLAHATLTKCDAKLVGTVGEGDDSDGTTEDTFGRWKSQLWQAMTAEMGLKQHETQMEPAFTVVRHADKTAQSPQVYLGELTADLKQGTETLAAPSRSNPKLAGISSSRELFKDKSRNCIHIEIDILAASYETGDHIGIWPVNADDDVQAFLEILGLWNDRFDVVSFTGTMLAPVPSPTTYDFLARHYLEICGPVSREGLLAIARFAEDEATRDRINTLAGSPENFKRLVHDRCMHLSAVLRDASGGRPWKSLPFGVLLEAIRTLTPRSYSISSSSLESPSTVSVTAVVEARDVPGNRDRFHGVSTNYLLAAHRAINDEVTTGLGRSYQLDGPRNMLSGFKVPFFINSSSFRLPTDSKTPVIMIGPGSGVAPFRGFVRHYMALKKQGVRVGRMILFFGCRNREQDFIYEDEWQEAKAVLGDDFEVVVAASREGPEKIYVQDRLREWSSTVHKLLEQQGHLYICGDAKHMAADVYSTLVTIIIEQRGINAEDARDVLKSMKSRKQIQEDTW